MTIDILSSARGIVGRRTKISRQEMADILASIAEAGLYLGNGYVPGTVVYDSSDGLSGEATDEPHPGAPRVWANVCTGITCVSVSGSGLRAWANIGTGITRATLIFAPPGLHDYDYDYLRAHCRRLLVVRDDQPLPDCTDLRALLPRQRIAAWARERNGCPDDRIHLTDSLHAHRCGLRLLSALYMLRHELEQAGELISGREVAVRLSPLIRMAAGEARDRLQAEIPGLAPALQP